MASEEHKFLSQYVKDIHSSLRKSSSKLGANEAWNKHCENIEVLETYAQSMQKLATEHWEDNCAKDGSLATSRIKWAVDLISNYFLSKSYLKYRQKELEICKKITHSLDKVESFTEDVRLLDVGSCYNPFKCYKFLNVLAIDLYPANDYVYQCDFINVPIGSKTIVEKNKIMEIGCENFDAVTFCFLLEYIPSSDLRVKTCENAYNVLKPGGLLIISTPDSKHVGANCKIMKNWQYTLACMGFSRIKYEKLKHMHCMAFRKSLNKDTALRWATLHKQIWMDYCIHIPQDFKISSASDEDKTETEINPDLFYELPFSSN